MATSKPLSSSDSLLVCAIDFGTTYSGWAYSFKHDYHSDPMKASVQHWHSGSSLVTEKTPTVALISSNGESLVAFGYEAENKYKEFVENGEHREYYYFRRFKMALNEDTITRNLTIKDEMGKSLPAAKVFSLSIDYLADSMIKSCNDRVTGTINKDDVHWVLTVPAIWSDAAKQFMREAAIKAKIKPEKLTVALEPEAASLFCRHLPADRQQNTPDVACFAAETQYLVLDAGGGTIDITVHEIDSSGGLKEIHAASGGGWGGILVDDAFEELLIGLFGGRVYEKFTKKETEDWLDLWRSFEVKKKTVEPDKTAKIIMKFPVSILELYKEETGCSLETMIKETQFASDINVRKDKVTFSNKMMKSLFDKSVKKTISHVKKVLGDGMCDRVRAILMVGGYSESSILKEAVKREFASLEVIVPLGASSAILRGAVLFGHNPLSITHRVLKKTYGVDIDTPFIDGVHPESKLEIIDGQRRCFKKFDKHVEIGQSVKVGEDQTEKEYYPTYEDSIEDEIVIYASDLHDPMLVDEGCVFVGRIIIDLSSMPKGLVKMDKGFRVSLSFSDTEIKATARIVKTGEIITGTFDFLG